MSDPYTKTINELLDQELKPDHMLQREAANMLNSCASVLERQEQQLQILRAKLDVLYQLERITNPIRDGHGPTSGVMQAGQMTGIADGARGVAQRIMEAINGTRLRAEPKARRGNRRARRNTAHPVKPGGSVSAGSEGTTG